QRVQRLKAQVAANQKGIYLLQDLIEEYTLEVVHAYMLSVLNNLHGGTRETFRRRWYFSGGPSVPANPRFPRSENAGVTLRASSYIYFPFACFLNLDCVLSLSL
ncbi:MAG: hypothetical protein EOP45_23360, partial [Sphingobacteriaceae bacterium]